MKEAEKKNKKGGFDLNISLRSKHCFFCEREKEHYGWMVRSWGVAVPGDGEEMNGGKTKSCLH